jgi:hypothetical protein
MTTVKLCRRALHHVRDQLAFVDVHAAVVSRSIRDAAMSTLRPVRRCRGRRRDLDSSSDEHARDGEDESDLLQQLLQGATVASIMLRQTLDMATSADGSRPVLGWSQLSTRAGASLTDVERKTLGDVAFTLRRQSALLDIAVTSDGCGCGLFAKCFIPRGTFVTVYEGFALDVQRQSTGFAGFDDFAEAATHVMTMAGARNYAMDGWAVASVARLVLGPDAGDDSDGRVVVTRRGVDLLVDVREDAVGLGSLLNSITGRPGVEANIQRDWLPVPAAPWAVPSRAEACRRVCVFKTTVDVQAGQELVFKYTVVQGGDD